MVTSRTGMQLATLLHLKGTACVYCPGVATTRDHVIPRSRGGSNDPVNLVPACFACNHAKGNRLPDEWRKGHEWHPYVAAAVEAAAARPRSKAEKRTSQRANGRDNGQHRPLTPVHIEPLTQPIGDRVRWCHACERVVNWDDSHRHGWVDQPMGCTTSP